MQNKASLLCMTKFISHSCARATAILLAAVIIGGCQRSPDWEADVSMISLEKVQIRRFDLLLAETDPDQFYARIKPHYEEFRLFLGENFHDHHTHQPFIDFLNNPLSRQLLSDTKKRLPDLKKEEAKLSEALRFYRAHFPEDEIPGFFGFISSLDYQHPVVLTQGNLVIGLDLFLGTDYPVYEQAGIPAYFRARMEAEYLPAEVFREIGRLHLGKSGIVPQSLLEHMIHEGKLLYFLDCMLPREPDFLKMSYTRPQMEWMQRHEGFAWRYLINNDLLFENDWPLIRRFTGEAPFTTAFDRESSPRSASYLGWQIVRSYMKNNPDKSLEDLLQTENARLILEKSGYRGR